jgi:tetratricopeptide (TPR) repeat protein
MRSRGNGGPTKGRRHTHLLHAAVAAVPLLCGVAVDQQANAAAMGSVTQGMAKADLVATLGKPTGTMRMGGRDILMFKDGEVELVGDRVVSVKRTSAPPVKQPPPAPAPVVKPAPGAPEPLMRRTAPPGTELVVIPQTMAHEILRLESRFGANQQDERVLNLLLTKAKKTLAPAPASVDGSVAKKHLEAIQSLLKQEGFAYGSATFLFEALRSRNSDCDTSALLYCAIGEVMGYPLGAVVLPRHAFVRWILPHGGVVNWEATEDTRDASFSDGTYYDCLLRGMTGEGCNLKTLTRKQLPSIHHYMAGLSYSLLQRPNEARAEYDAALKIDPTCYMARLAKGRLCLQNDSYADGATEMLKAMEYLPVDGLGQVSAAALAMALLDKQDTGIDRKQLGRIVQGFMRADADSAGYVILTAMAAFLDDRVSSAMADLDGACGKWPNNFVPFACRSALRTRSGDAAGAKRDAETASRLMQSRGVTRRVRVLP